MKTNRKGRGKRKGHSSQRIFGNFVCLCCFKNKQTNTEEPTNAMTLSIPNSIHEFLKHTLPRDLINIRNQQWMTLLP